MILVDHQIREAIEKGWIKVDPFDEKLINPASLNVRLGRKFGRVRGTREVYRMVHVGPSYLKSSYDAWGGDIPKDVIDKTLVNAYRIIDPTDKDSFSTGSFEADSIILDPGDFVIACLMEDITLPDFICASLRGRSSLGRLGIDNSSPAGHIDNGWSGVLTIELANHNPNVAIRLTAGMSIGQLIFYQTEPAERPYGETGRYQRQKPGQGSKGV